MYETITKKFACNKRKFRSGQILRELLHKLMRSAVLLVILVSMNAVETVLIQQISPHRGARACRLIGKQSISQDSF